MPESGEMLAFPGKIFGERFLCDIERNSSVIRQFLKTLLRFTIDFLKIVVNLFTSFFISDKVIIVKTNGTCFCSFRSNHQDRRRVQFAYILVMMISSNH